MKRILLSFSMLFLAWNMLSAQEVTPKWRIQAAFGLEESLYEMGTNQYWCWTGIVAIPTFKSSSSPGQSFQLSTYFRAASIHEFGLGFGHSRNLSEITWDYGTEGVETWEKANANYWNLRFSYRTLIRPEKRLSYFWENAIQYDRLRTVDQWQYAPEVGLSYRQEAGLTWITMGNTRLHLGAFFMTGLTQKEYMGLTESLSKMPFGYGVNLGVSQSFGKVKNQYKM